MPLTDPECRNAKCPEGKPYKRFADGGGLYLQVTSTGSKLWRWKYRYAGKEKVLALGAYPEVPLASPKRPATDGSAVKGARTLRDEARALLAKGIDPGEARREAKRSALVASDTAFEAVARQWWDTWRTDKTERHARYMLRRLELDAFPAIGHKSVAALTAPDFVRMAKSIEARGAIELARRVLEACGQVMRYAVAHGLADRNPVADVKPGDVLQRRAVQNYARVGADELPELMRKLMAYEGSVLTRMALQLMALTFVRTSELVEARWGEFDLDAGEWTISAERTGRKGRASAGTRRPHWVPLTRQALEVLGYLRTARGEERCAGTALVFPGERDHERPMSRNTLLAALNRMGYRGRQTGHGFRGIFSTWANEAGFRSDVIEAQLSHVEKSSTRAAYNHAQYLDERRDLMQSWADYLDAVKQTGKVIPFRQGRTAKAAA